MSPESPLTITATDDGVLVDNGRIALDILTAFGPRVRSFARANGPSLFASLPDMTLPVGDGRQFSLVGGHRLWAGPEQPHLTYVPDDRAVEVDRLERGVRLTAPAPPETGLAKILEVTVQGDSVKVDHTLTNTGDTPTSVAPWAITMLRPGGVGILPLGRNPEDQLQAERSLVLWPYTDPADPLIRIDRHQVTLWAERDDPIKFGTAATRGWLAYTLDEEVFVKRTTHSRAAHVDLGATAQIYVNPDVCELETLGPLTNLAPGAHVSHEETWELGAVDSIAPDSELSHALRQGAS